LRLRRSSCAASTEFMAECPAKYSAPLTAPTIGAATSAVRPMGYCLQMATDPAPFLSTIAGSSSGLVAIVGGLLVARFVSLDSEQAGAQRVLDDAEARLLTARQRVQEAADRLLRRDARDLLYNRDVIQAILEGVTDLAELRRQGQDTRLTDEQLAPFVEEIRGELAHASQVLEEAIPDSVEVETDGWDAFFRSTPTLPVSNWDLAWEIVFDRICERRATERAAAAEREAAEREAAQRALAERFPGIAGGLSALEKAGRYSALAGWRPPAIPLGAVPLGNTDWQSIRARRRDELVASLERAEQHVEDVEGEVRRFRQARDAIVRPQGLVLGLAILGYFALVGILVPTLLMSLAPADLTPRLGILVFAGFFSGLVALLGYMGLLAVRLSRHAATAKVAQQGQETGGGLLRRMLARRAAAR
jgi:hypothetical protein